MTPISLADQLALRTNGCLSTRIRIHIVTIMAICLVCACRRDVKIATGKAALDRRAAELAERDQIQAALDFLFDYDRYPQESALARVLHHLRKWTEDLAPDDDWIADPMFGRLPDRLGLSKNIAELARLRFRPDDVVALREVLWYRQLSHRLEQAGEIDLRYRPWLDSLADEVSSAELRELQAVLAIFDWVMRNVQIEPQEINAFRSRSAEGSAGIDLRASVHRTAWESLATGRGDALCRARLVILLARQLDIPVVLLAVDKPDEPPPFLLAAHISQQLYLFEPEVALPVESAGGTAIATWSELQADPALLHQFDTKEKRYHIRESDLDHMVALIDATPQALSQRMRLLELALPKNHRAVLSVSPTTIRRSLPDQPGIRRFAIWTKPYDVRQFRATQATRYPDVVRSIQQELQPLTPPWPLAFARRQHIFGIFTDEERNEGALRLYLATRLSDRQIQQVNSAESLQGLFVSLAGATGGIPDDPALLPPLLAATQQILIASRQSASYWLGLIAYEQRNYRVAVDYFDQRVLATDGASRWRVGALYNMARSLAMMGTAEGDLEVLRRAESIYRQESASPQGPGNLIRADRLAEQIRTLERNHAARP